MLSKKLLSIVGCGCVALSAYATEKKEVAQRPNILFILSDEHAGSATRADGGINVQLPPTPNIDVIGLDGAIKHNWYYNNSISGLRTA